MIRRYLTAASRERLVVSRVVSSLGLGILAVLGVLWFQDPQATLLQVAPFGLVGLALIAGSKLLARKHRQYLRVDFATRKATFVAKGKERWSATLDELGPVVCAPFERRRYIPYRSEQPERLSQGTEAGTPGKAVRPTGRTWSYGWEGQLAVRAGRLGRPQSPTKGSTARKPRQLPEVARST